MKKANTFLRWAFVVLTVGILSIFLVALCGGRLSLLENNFCTILFDFFVLAAYAFALLYLILGGGKREQILYNLFMFSVLGSNVILVIFRCITDSNPGLGMTICIVGSMIAVTVLATATNLGKGLSYSCVGGYVIAQAIAFIIRLESSGKFVDAVPVLAELGLSLIVAFLVVTKYNDKAARGTK